MIEIWISERGNDPYDTLVGYEHFFKNITSYLNHPGAGYIRDLFKGKPAVVVATGPSLKKNIHQLKEVENSAVILSADSSLRILHDYNIFPHFVATVERTPGFDKQYLDLDNHDQTVFAAISFVHPTTLTAWNGPVIFFNRFLSFMRELNVIDDAVDLGLSTANMAYGIAKHMGCDPIILIGNDLSYDEHGNSHSKGFLYGEKQEIYENFDKIEVPGNTEPFVLTNYDWYKCIKMYEKSIKDWEGTLINASEGGAKISGSKVIPLKETIKNFCQTPFDARSRLQNHLGNWEKTRSVESILYPTAKFIQSLDPVVDVCKKMVEILSPIVRKIESAGDKLPELLIYEISESIKPVEEAMNGISNLEVVTSFNEYFNSEILPVLMEWQVINQRFQDINWALAYKIKIAEEFFKTIGQLCISLKPVLQDGEERLQEMLKANQHHQ